MAFTKSLLNLPLRDASLDDDDLGAGLYVDETLVLLDTGDLIAVSVFPHREPASGGLVVCAWARACDVTGHTLLDNAGAEIENEFRATFTAQDVANFTTDHLKRQVLLLVLGEPLDDPVDENGISTGPLKVAAEIAQSVSIRNDLSMADEAAQSEADGAGVLFPL